jgi:hypothetical protein
MEVVKARTATALFVALTRAVREASLADDARTRAYEVIDRMASVVNCAGFSVELDALITFAAREPLLDGALQPFWRELCALSVSSTARPDKPRNR